MRCTPLNQGDLGPERLRRALGRAHVRADEKVIVIGGAPVGLLIALVALAAGAEVRVVELNVHRRALAEKLGLTARDPTANLPELVKRWTNDAGADVAFEVSGTQGGVEAAVDALAVRGRLCLVAIHPTPRGVNLHRLFWRELTLVGARLYDRGDFEKAAALVADGTIPAELLITSVPLTDAPAAFEALEYGGDVMTILLDCTDMTNVATADAA